jgi:NAD(P)-dependent dehydrogenase (short-subunit alcohol dehydrogenase family)
MAPKRERVWFVTGASRGLGRAIVDAAVGAGDIVVATARRPEALREALAPHGDRAVVLELDVTDRAAIADVVRRAVETTGGIDVVVNNAGYGLAGAIEEVTEQEARDQLETNFFGALWVSQSVLEPLRQRGGGHLLQISSIAGIGAYPMLGLYHASKWALEGMSESLSHEVRPFGIRVTIVEPGSFRTDWAGGSMARTTPLNVYEPTLGAMRGHFSGANAGSEPGDPARAAAVLLALVDEPDPPLRLLLGSLAADRAPVIGRARLTEWEAWDEVARRADFHAD